MRGIPEFLTYKAKGGKILSLVGVLISKARHVLSCAQISLSFDRSLLSNDRASRSTDIVPLSFDRKLLSDDRVSFFLARASRSIDRVPLSIDRELQTKAKTIHLAFV